MQNFVQDEVGFGVSDSVDSPFKKIKTDLILKEKPPKGRRSKATQLINVSRVGSFRFEGAGPPDSGLTSMSKPTENPDQSSWAS